MQVVKNNLLLIFPILNCMIHLKDWRDEICDKTGMPIYMVANRATLAEIATYLPLDKKDLLQISGFGKAKVDKYGDEILKSVAEYCARQ